MGEDAATLPRCQTRHATAQSPRNSLGHERLAFCLDSSPANLPLTPPPQLQDPAPTATPLRGYIDAPTGILLSAEVPNPPMPTNDKDQQLGQKPHTLGRLLPGLITALPLTATIPGAKMDEQGLLLI